MAWPDAAGLLLSAAAATGEGSVQQLQLQLQRQQQQHHQQQQKQQQHLFQQKNSRNQQSLVMDISQQQWSQFPDKKGTD